MRRGQSKKKTRHHCYCWMIRTRRRKRRLPHRKKSRSKPLTRMRHGPSPLERELWWVRQSKKKNNCPRTRGRTNRKTMGQQNLLRRHQHHWIQIRTTRGQFLLGRGLHSFRGDSRNFDLHIRPCTSQSRMILTRRRRRLVRRRVQGQSSSDDHIHLPCGYRRRRRGLIRRGRTFGGRCRRMGCSAVVNNLRIVGGLSVVGSAS